MSASLEGLQPEFRQRLELMLSEGSAAFTLNYGFRSRAEQQRLYDIYLAGKGSPANKPGTSKHELGEAADVACDAKHNKLRADLAKKYGFLQPYFKSEPWHLELDPARKPLSAPTIPLEGDDDMPGPDGQVRACSCSTGGWWVLTRDGGVRAEGGAPFFGSYPGLPPQDRQGDRFFIDIEERTDGVLGYWLYASDDSRYGFPK